MRIKFIFHRMNIIMLKTRKRTTFFFLFFFLKTDNIQYGSPFPAHKKHKSMH